MAKSTLIIFAILLSCVFAPDLFAAEKYAPNLKIEYVIQTAKEYSNKQGYKTEEYFIRSIEYVSAQKEWTIFFEGKILAFGNHFLIVINDKTKAIELSHGG